MTATLENRERVRERIEKWVWPRPISFEEFLDLFTGREEIVELIDGAVMEREMVQLDHEELVLWLLTILRPFARRTGLGRVLGSRSAVKINEYRSRLPDLLFVARERDAIVQQRATYGAPDLVIEVASPSDRPSLATGLEADYRTIGVREMVFVDLPRRRVRVVRKEEGGYAEQTLIAGTLRLESLGAAELDIAWVLGPERPDEQDVLAELLARRDP